MATPFHLDRAHETTQTQGDTNPYQLLGAASGMRTFVAAATLHQGTGPWDVGYVVSDGTTWELRVGVLTDASPDTITRGTLFASSTGSAINWGPGTRDIFAAPLSAILNALFRTAVGVLEKTADTTWAATPIGAAGRALLDDATASDALTTLGVSAFVKTLLDDANAAAFFTTLGITAFVQTLLDDANAGAVLTTLGVSAFIQTLLDDANAAAARTTLGIPDPATALLRWDSGFYFESSEQTVGNQDDARIAHGLGSKPRMIAAVLRCTSVGEHDYVVGDEIALGSTMLSGGGNRGIMFGVEGTGNFDLWYAVSTDPFEVIPKSGGNFQTATPSRWRIVLRAWK